MRKVLIFVILPLGVLLAQGQDENDWNDHVRSGAVYTMTNTAPLNQLVTFRRATDGRLTWEASLPTGGVGTGAALGSDNAVQLSRNGRWLLTVNAGDNSISVFEIDRGRPELVSVTPSGGKQPESVAIYGDLVYVLNGGSPANVTGFRLRDGWLVPIPNSTRPLSTASPASPQVGFDDDGGLLLTTEKATNLIDTYVVRQDGTLNDPNSQPSAGQTPFGFLFDRRGHLLVTDAFGGAAGESAASSYNVSSNGSLHVISGAVNNGQAAACWIAVTRDNRYVYVTNTASNNISAYLLDHDGSLRVIGDGITATTGPGPVDIDLSRDSRFLYVLNGGAGTVQGYRVRHDGSLEDIGTFASLPLSSTGLAAR